MKYKDIDTPSLIVIKETLIENIKSVADLLKGKKVSLRPHTKTHKCPEIAKMQIDNGARGITVAKLGEAEIMSSMGFKDILIAYPVFGELKKERLIKVLNNTTNLIISLDSYEVATFLSKIGLSIKNKVQILFEINTGLNRSGAKPNYETINIIKEINNLPGIKFKGLMIYPGRSYTLKGKSAIKNILQKEYNLIMDFNKKLQNQGINCEIISSGSTPSIEFERNFKGINELRPGSYIFYDRSHIEMNLVTENNCAARVLATVVSIPDKNRAIIDAGSKAIGKEILFNNISRGFGLIKDRPDLLIENLDEEHGILKSLNANVNLQIGERLEVIPNHICITINNFNNLILVENDNGYKEIKIACRGKYQ